MIKTIKCLGAASILATFLAACSQSTAQDIDPPVEDNPTRAIEQSVAETQIASMTNPSDLVATNGTYVSDPTHTSLVWSAPHLGLSDYRVRMDGVAITVELNADDPSLSSVTAEIDPLSVSTGYPDESVGWNEKVATDDDKLDGDTYPSITYRSTSVTRTGDRTARIDGELTLLGITRPVSMDAEYFGSIAEHPFANGAPAIGFSATGTFDRTAFGNTADFGGSLGNMITVDVHAELVRQPDE